MRTLENIPIARQGGLMSKLSAISRKIFLLCLFIAAATPCVLAQGQGIDCSLSPANTNKLGCLIPKTVTPAGYTFSDQAFTFGSTQLVDSLQFLPSGIASEVSQIPLASPASGIIFTIDPTLHVPVPSNQSFGPVLTQRASTIGRHKLYIATTYQYFLLESADSHSLKDLPTVFALSSNGDPSNPDTLAIGNDRIDLKIHQFVWYTTFGLTDRIDVSIDVPVLRVDMRDTVNEKYRNNTVLVFPSSCPLDGSNPPGCWQKSLAEEATGIGDIEFGIKANVWKRQNGGGITIGGEVRTPTGDAANFLGSGALGVKPYINFTLPGRVSPHANIGYQGNGFSQQLSPGRRLPDRLFYSGGADWKALSRLTVAADILAQDVISGPRAILVPATTSGGFQLPASIQTEHSSYNRTDASLGLKVRPFGNFLLTGNVLVALDHSGLRQNWAPMLGLSTSF